MKEIDFDELEKEIDRAIDTLFVTEEEKEAKGAKPSEVPVEEKGPPEGGVPFQLDEDLQRDLEGIEVELLTLEWEFKPEGVRRAVELLQGLRERPLPEGLAQGMELLQKALHRFLLDESNVTPEGVKFVQDLWKFLKGVAEGGEPSSERLETFQRDYDRLFQRVVPVPEKPKVEPRPAFGVQELVRAWERMELLLSEAMGKLQELRDRVAAEKRSLLEGVPSPRRGREMALFRRGGRYVAIDPKRIARTVPTDPTTAASFLKRGRIRLRDGTLPLHPSSEGEGVGDSPLVVIFQGEGGLQGFIADEALGRGAVTITSSGALWQDKRVEVIL